MTNTECYLCQGKEFKQRPGRVRDKAELKVLECRACGLVFLSSFDHICRDFYEEAGMWMSGDSHIDIAAAANEEVVDTQRRFEYLKPLLVNRRVLDFGCGTGSFCRNARTVAAEVEGVEVESRLADHFQKANLNVYRKISDIPVGKKYDVITLCHVLEHLADPKNILLEISGLLAEQGQVIIEVPNADDALFTLYENEAFSRFGYWGCHLYLFNAQTLGMLAGQAGFRVNYIRQVQRYPLSNHLYWLCKGKPGGHQQWHFLTSPLLGEAYESRLAAIGKCDTIVAGLSKLNV